MKLIGVDKAERKPVTYREAVFAPINRQKERVVTFAICTEIDSWHAKIGMENLPDFFKTRVSVPTRVLI